MENNTEFFQPKPLRHVLGEKVVLIMEAKKQVHDAYSKTDKHGFEQEAYNQCTAIADMMLDNAIAFYNVK